MPDALITSPVGILAVLTGVAALFFYLENATGWKLFSYLPPLVFIYLVPVVLSNTGFIPTTSPAYSWIRSAILPMILVLLLLKVDVAAAVRLMGKGVFVMLFGTLGVVVGAPIAYLIVKVGLSPEGWKAFGTLAGSWIGGTGNMAAVSEMIDAGGTEFGLAVLGDTVIYLVWLPIMLASRNFAGAFARFTRVSPDRLQRMEKASKELDTSQRKVELYHYIYLIFIGMAVTWAAVQLSTRLPEIPPYVSAGTWKILAVTTIGIALSLTPLRRIPGSFELAMGLLYIFVARMGASADLGGVAAQAPWFLLGGFIWIFIHGGFCLLGARLFSVDVHTAAIASAANIGGAASAPIVAAYHKESLVPASILLALIGYAVGNYAGYLTAVLCKVVG
ncbi:MAG: DUF819 domain-containing protein [Candidatus Krumholzibacteriia bacterium]